MQHDIPSWFGIWQSIDSLLRIGLDAGLVFPLMLALCLLAGRTKHREAMAAAGRLCLGLGLGAAAFGLLDILCRALVDLRFLPDALPNLEPLPFEPFSLPWLSSTSTALLWIAGMLLLWLAGCRGERLWGTAALATDPATARSLRRQGTLAAVVALLSFTCLFATVITRNWPFLGLPDQMTREGVFLVLLNHGWRLSCSALMPAGALAVLAFFLGLPPIPAQELAAGRAARKGDVTGNTQPFALAPEQATTLRMAAAFAIAGAVFQFLDAGFLAFGYGSGIRGRGMIFTYGPFVVTALSLACWIYLFSRPRRTGLFLALLPVMFLVLRAVVRF